MVQLVFQIIFWSAGLPLMLLVIAAMLRGPYKQFPVLFLYEVVSFLLTVAGMPSYIAFYFQHDLDARGHMAHWDFLNDAILEPLAYAVVISLIYVVASHVKSRRMVLASTIGGASLIAGVSFLLHFGRDINPGVWMNLWNRDLNFFSEILDLGLWGLLLSTKGRDTRLLMVTGALGIQFTGEAIGEALRSIAAQDRSSPFSHTMSYIGGFVTTIAYLTALYVFWQAFRKGRNAKAAARKGQASVETPNSH